MEDIADLGLQVRTGALLHTGRSDACGGVRRGPGQGMVRVRRGAYVEERSWEAASSADRHRYLVRATLAAVHSPAVLSHESAAVILGIPLVGVLPRAVQVTDEVASGRRPSRFVQRHRVRSMPDVVTVDGVAVTCPARTVVDIARSRSFASSLAAADWALRTGAVTVGELEAEVQRAGAGRGVRQARAVVAFADGRSESVGESVSRGRMYELNLPIPELQHEFRDENGFVARSDFWWEHLGLAGEFDGRVKYGVTGSPAEAAEVLWQEKIREDRLRRLVAGVVRWTWATAWDRARFAAVMAGAGVLPR